MRLVYDVFRGACGYVNHCDLSSSSNKTEKI